ncbi:MAG: hydantoinase B/oxoprolinase family protein, partial [Anaerolineales bacterium]
MGQRGAAAPGDGSLGPVSGTCAHRDALVRAESDGVRTDPFTVEIIGEMLRASAEEMFVTLGRTAQSPIIYEVLDIVTSPQAMSS